MDDKQKIEALYREMYEAMVAKDTATLNRVHADDFVLTHMTGMHQSKQEYIRAIANGTLNDVRDGKAKVTKWLKELGY